MSDLQIEILSSVLCFLAILFSLKYSRRFALLNGIAFLLYTIQIYYGLAYKSQEGTGLVWEFLLVLLSAIQIIIVGGYLLYRFFKR